MTGNEEIRDNRNPYHIYNTLPIEQLADPIALNGAELPDRRKAAIRKWDGYNYGKYFGFNYSETKDSLGKQSFPSLVWTGELTDYTYKTDPKFKKDGTPYRKRAGNPVYDPAEKKWIHHGQKAVMAYISEDIQSFWLHLNRNRQVSSGLTHNERRVLVCDFDDDPLREGLLEELEIICQSAGLPHFTYLERHMDNDHFQIGWILDKPFIYYSNEFKSEKSLFCRCIHKLADIFDSDHAFTGWHIKNPVCVFKTDTRWFNDMVSKEKMIEALTKHKYTAVQDIPHKQTKTAVSGNSRNISLFNALREWYKGQPHDEALRKAYELSASVSKSLNKPMLSDAEIRRQLNSVEKYWPVRKKMTESTKRQKLGNLVSSCKKERDALRSYLEYLKHPGRKVHPYITENMSLVNQHKWSKLIPSIRELKKMKISKYAPLVKETEYLLEQVRKKSS